MYTASVNRHAQAAEDEEAGDSERESAMKSPPACQQSSDKKQQGPRGVGER